jgi:hypothetical protein
LPLSAPKNWQITVGEKANILAEFEVPIYRLDGRALYVFLKALVARARSESYEDMARFYINRRRGDMFRDARTKIGPFFNYDLRLNGYFCGDWECYARAAYEISAEQADAIKALHDQNRRGV